MNQAGKDGRQGIFAFADPNCRRLQGAEAEFPGLVRLPIGLGQGGQVCSILMAVRRHSGHILPSP